MALVAKRNGDPTVDQIQTDVITQLSVKYWAPFGNVPKSPFNAEIIELIYQEELIKTNFLTKRIMVLECGQYLENYLWPNFTENASKAHIMSIIAVINEKCRERVQVWESLQMPLGNFSTFFHKAMDLSIDEALTFEELCVVITFFINAFNNLGNELVRNEVVKVCNILMWTKISGSKRNQIFKDFPRHKKAFLRYKKCLEVNPKGKKSKEEIQEDVDSEEGKKMLEMRKKEVEFKLKEAEFLAKNIERFLSVLEQIQSEGPVNEKCICYCERFLEWMIDVESQLFTRKFFTVVLDSYQIVVKCRMSSLVKREKEGHLFRQLLDLFQFYCRFEIDDFTGEALSESDMMKIHSDKVLSCQKVVFQNFPELRSLALSNVGRVSDRKSLMQYLSGLSNGRLHELASQLNLISEPDESKPEEFTSEFLLEILIYHLEVRQSQLEMLNEMPLYPTENIIWDENVVPTQYHGGSGSTQAASSGLALPKLNLLFLTVHDYLLRNFNLFRLESTYEIRQDIENNISRMKPYLGNDGACSFEGWSQMAQPIVSFNIVEVTKPNVGKKHPARVRANLTVNLKKNSKFERKKNEWESLKKHDIVFLITLRPHNPEGCKFDFKEDFVSQVGLVHVRGCEIEGMLDENGKIIEEGLEQKPEFKDNNRTFRVILDPNQYYQDMNQSSEDPYLSFNVVMRRRPKENNFKAVLETIRDLMNTKCVIPSWLHEKILGYKEKVEVKSQEIPTLDFKDTFLNFEHLKSSFPSHKVILKDSFVENEAKKSKIDSTEIVASPPYKLTFCETKDGMSGDNEDTIIVEPYQQKVIGPYPVTYPKKNSVPFTKTQAEAILSGMQPGLTMIVGPPGTGKTDVAVQIISNLYHNFPKQRTLIVTHSNQALNQLFEKIMCLDIEERHMLRLGHGEEELETDKDYSRYGRVNYVLSQRMELLEKVQKLEASLGMASYQQHTCETAEFFFIQVLAKYQEFEAKLRKSGNSDVEEISIHFPFHNFFADAPQPLFKKNSFEEDMNIAINCFEYIEQIFSQLKEFRPFELFRNGKDRVKYLLIKEARIIAMTCTHAALKRRDLVEAGFQYDNIIFEEAAQILEIETFVPLLLQNPEHGQSRLKRWIMIGDHHQLPPVIKNMAFQKFSNMEQSLFARFVNIGYQTVELDAQGRSRPSICNLFNWRYKNLGNLPHLTSQPEYLHANPGVYFDYQLIDVQDFNGEGESAPNPFFYQNLAEAEYICRFYMYLRLIGYPAEKIVILTTYNGQKHLIRDVCDEICKGNRLLGLPSKITTVDRYQGQQNDIVLLSLVRTKNVGHLRDVRRLVVAMSRARLGLYIFGRVELFRNCLELIPVFSQLLSRPLQLYLAPMETYKTVRAIDQFPNNPPLIIKNMEHMCNFVENFYQGKAQAFRKEYELQQQQQQLEAEAIIEEIEPDDLETDDANAIIQELPIDPPDDNQQNECSSSDKEEVEN